MVSAREQSGGAHGYYRVTMKTLHRGDLFGWSSFDEARNIDFHSVAWVRPEGNVLVDPLPLSPHDERHLRDLGGAAWIVVTNGDHTRASAAIAAAFGARVAGPAGEKDTLALRCDRWLGDGDELVPGLRAIALHGSKTPGELALLLEETTLITGDLVRAHRGGQLMILPDAKLRDRARAVESVHGLLSFTRVDAVLVGDGWHVFRDAHARLAELDRRLRAPS